MDFPQNCQSCPVWNQSLFKGIEADLIQWLMERRQVCVTNKKQALFEQGQAVSGIHCHLSGLVKVTQKDKTDRILFSRLVLPGDTSGHRSLFISNVFKGTATVISDQVRTCFIAKPDISHLLSNSPVFARNLVAKIAGELRRSEEEHILVKEKTVRERLAIMLLELCHLYADSQAAGQFVFKSEITKRDIASLLAVANETVIRLMSEMRELKIIDYQQRKIMVTDIVKLREMAGAEYK